MHIVSQSASVSYSLFPSRASAPLALPPPPDRLRLNPPPARLLLPAPRSEIQGSAHRLPPTYQADLMATLGPVRSRQAMNAELAEMATDALHELRAMRVQIAEFLAARERRL